MKVTLRGTIYGIILTLLLGGAILAVGGGILNDANNWQNLQTFNNGIAVSRIITGRGTATALAAADFALGGNWGTSPSVGTPTGTDQAYTVTVTAGSGSPGANPTLTLTFHDGTWTNVPVCLTKLTGGSGAAVQLSEAPTATTNVITFIGTPTASATYTFTSYCFGR